MNHEVLKQVIRDQIEVIKQTQIVERKDYVFEENANYILVGLRRSGKSTLLYNRVKELLKNGVEESQIIYITFEDERLLEFNVNDFNDILEVKSELTQKEAYFFFDEIQNIDGWEKFARRMADSKKRVYITGSNAKMLSSEMNAALGGRFVQMYVTPYSFKEYLLAKEIKFDGSTKSKGEINKAYLEYENYGGLPETLLFVNKRDYLKGVYQKIVLNDIILHNKIRQEQAIKLMAKKLAETTKDEISYTKLCNIINSIGIKISKDTIIDYVGYFKDSNLIFELKEYYSHFVDKESTPKYYFRDNGLLGLFLVDKEGILLENLIATQLRRTNEELYYIKSSKTGIDIDFYIPQERAIQVACELNDDSYERETKSLVKFAKANKEKISLEIVTKGKTKEIEVEGIKIKVVNVIEFLSQK